MTQPVILVLCDGIGNDAAQQHMRYMEALVRAGRAIRLTTRPAQASECRANYETLHTGVSPAIHGIMSDTALRKPARPTTFEIASSAGLSTAAVGYTWASDRDGSASKGERCGSESFQPGGPADHGCVYSSKRVPDSEVFAHGADLVSRHAPHYALVHPMGVDAVPKPGTKSCEYGRAVRHQDEILAELVPDWIAGGYAIVVTSGHGPGTSSAGARESATPLYLTGARGSVSVGPAALGNERVAPTIWSLLGLRGPADAAPPLVRPMPRKSPDPTPSERSHRRLDHDVLLRCLGLT